MSEPAPVSPSFPLICCPNPPPQAAALGGMGWVWRTVAEPSSADAGATVVLLWCADRTALAQWLGGDRPFGAPVLLLSPPPTADERRLLLSRGVLQWLPSQTDATALHEALLWVQDLATQLQARDSAALARLEERKWTERAKGLLMQARGIDEAAAFALLRSTAMQTQAKLPEVARGVVHTSELAEALERAGAQRMLSQRLVKLQALRQWPRLSPPERRECQLLLDTSAERVAGNLTRLAELLRHDLVDELAAVSAAWTQLHVALTARPPDLTRSDRAAQRLLEASEVLVAKLSERAGQRPVGLLAQVTRLRLLSQRLAKEGLLSQVLPGHDASGLTAGLDEFLKAYEQVRAAPLAGPALQPAFAAVDEAWLVLLRGLRVEQGDAVQRMHQGSERLLQALEALIRALQGSLQLILG
ncbi:ANTAR domain-containing response regulator [Roseateles cellulosilyticus]|uniref:ANTAR domain-containing protein n=1 Tax=Pelomonas cellulosilytica TaxID=2906762 RepID=A0ABS8XUV2_9BURK|nr:ANTAR domain-containing protein [Pelomonas sp. P8]MCE4556451.1 ANTAR domain-containing protein [Pelomonas sp. P8]